MLFFSAADHCDLKARDFVRSFVLILSRNNGAEPKRLCKGGNRVISGGYKGLESPTAASIAMKIFLLSYGMPEIAITS